MLIPTHFRLLFYCTSTSVYYVNANRRKGWLQENKAKEECCASRVEHAWWYMGVCKVEQLTLRRKVLVVYFLCSPEAEQ